MSCWRLAIYYHIRAHYITYVYSNHVITSGDVSPHDYSNHVITSGDVSPHDYSNHVITSGDVSPHDYSNHVTTSGDVSSNLRLYEYLCHNIPEHPSILSCVRHITVVVLAVWSLSMLYLDELEAGNTETDIIYTRLVQEPYLCRDLHWHLPCWHSLKYNWAFGDVCRWRATPQQRPAWISLVWHYYLINMRADQPLLSIHPEPAHPAEFTVGFVTKYHYHLGKKLVLDCPKWEDHVSYKFYLCTVGVRVIV